MSRCEAAVFSIGHSNHSLEAFSGLLAQYRIDVLADVRSTPHSRFNPQFNRDALAVDLNAREVEYAYFGRELGGRPRDPLCYEGGRVCYDRVAATRGFQRGLAKVMDAAKSRRIALMCAEKEPLDCHRTLLVARALDAQGVEVHHILADGRLETHADTITRLLKHHDLNPDGDMFATHEELIALAIGQRAKRVAFAQQAPRSGAREVR